MGTVKKVDIEKMYRPKKENIEKLERYIEKLKEQGEIKDGDIV